MSFQRKPVEISFPEGHELHGLQVRARRARVEHVEAVYAISGNEEEDIRTSVIPAMRAFGTAIVSWNYVDEDGNDVPATADGFASIDIEAQVMILGAWAEAAAGTSKSLGKGSDSGPSSREQLLRDLPTMTSPTLSAALANLPMHSEPSESSNASAATR